VSFSRVYGHQRAIQVLQSAISNDRLAGAYLFVGPPGVGKALVAREFIKALNCQSGTNDACDQCPNCRMIDRDEFPDMYIPAKQGKQIGKGTSSSSRDPNNLVHIQSRLHYPPMMGRTKSVLIDPADALTDEAGNMLLKTLEEPPRQTVFILVTTLESAVLPTIVSRCQRLRFPPLKADDVAGFLEHERSLPAELAKSVSLTSQGSIERALELALPGKVEQKRRILDYLFSVFSDSFPVRVNNSLQLLMDVAPKERQSAVLVGSIAAMFSRDLLQISVGLGRDDLLFPEEADRLIQLGKRLTSKGALHYAALVREFSEGLRRNENPKHLLYHLSITSNRLVRPLDPSVESRSLHA
jgi:DNA polymerase III subunit delta'